MVVMKGGIGYEPPEREVCKRNYSESYEEI